MTQCDQVLAYLQENIAITDTVARELFGINRLAARIWDLRRKGYEIESETLYFTTRLGRMGKYAVYRLKE